MDVMDEIEADDATLFRDFWDFMGMIVRIEAADSGLASSSPKAARNSCLTT